MINKYELPWRRQSKYYSWQELFGIYTAAVNELGVAAFGAGRILQAPSEATIRGGAFSAVYAGLEFSDAAAKKLYGILVLPRNLDVNYPVKVRINWTNTNDVGAGEGVTWTFLYALIKKGILIPNDPATVLDTPIVESLISAASAFEWTDNGIINKLNLTQQELDAGACLAIAIENTTVDAGIANLRFLGLEINYQPLMCLIQSDIDSGESGGYDPATL